MSRDIREIFGSKVRLARNKRKITQEELAEKAGLHSTYIGQIERGIRNPSLININKIKNALKIQITEIFP